MSSLSQDELGHAAALYGLLGELTGLDADTIAYDREPAEYRHARLLDHGRGDWAITIARRYLYETADAVRLDALTGGSWSPLADLVGKIAREERYHRMHVDAWLDRLANGGSETPTRLAAALEQLGPDAGTVFTPLPGEEGLVEAGVLAAPMAALAFRDPASAGRPRPAGDSGHARPGRRPHGSRRRFRMAAIAVHDGPPRRSRSDVVIAGAAPRAG